MLALFIYVGVGAGLAFIGLCVPSFGRRIDRMAARMGMDVGYGRAVWLGGTILAWPIGLYVLATGRLVLVDTDLSATTDDDGLEAKPEEPLSTDAGRWITGNRSGP